MTAAVPSAYPPPLRRPAAILMFALIFVGCRSGPSARAEACEGGACPAEITLAGRLHAVRNGLTRWFLVDAGGRENALAVAEGAADGLGLDSLDRRLVTITGVRLADGTIAVQTIAPDSVGGR